MGASDVVPGVSGGTIAFISGIYERLIFAIKNLNLTAIKLFFTGKFKEFWKHIDGTFLLFLVLGIATSFLSLAKLITYLIDTHPVLVWSFFFGLIMASIYFVGRQVKWSFKSVATLLVFAIISFFITSPTNAPLVTDSSLWYIFLCGAIAICAMILPGISGSFILLLLGQYKYILESLTAFNIPVILVFILGAGVGIISFANVLSWLFKHYEVITLAALTGFLLGSLNKIWPWKETIEFYTDRHGEVLPLIQENILPNANSQLLFSIALIVLGFSIIFILEYIASSLKKKNK